MKRILMLLAAAAACHTLPARAADLLMEKAAFQQCETEAFIALIVHPRNGMHLKDTRESLLAIKSNGDFQIRTINQLFDEMQATGSRDHGGFAARKFYECAGRERLGLKEDVPGATVCLARHDIVFYATGERSRAAAGRSAVAGREILGKSSRAVYPAALIDQIVPMVYRVASPDDDHELRQLVFETCLFPEEWQAWYEATQHRGK